MAGESSDLKCLSNHASDGQFIHATGCKILVMVANPPVNAGSS